MDIKLPFGLRDGTLMHIKEISRDEKGAKCNCICPACGDKLIARLGNERIHHFAHANEECGNALETALHLFAKEVLQRNSHMSLPALKLYYSSKSQTVDDIFTNNKWVDTKNKALNDIREMEIAKETVVIFDNVESEMYLDTIRPDIVLYKNKIPLLIEIAVTHYIDSKKYHKIKNLNISTIEIDLGHSDINFYNFNKQQLENLIINSVECKNWIYHRKAEIEKNKILEENRRLAEITEKERQAQEKKQQRKEALMRNKQDAKIGRIKKLIAEDNYAKKLIKFESDIIVDQNWIKASDELGIRLNTIPEFLNKKVPGELAIDYDRRIWQSMIFSEFISNKQYKTVKVADIVQWIKNTSRLKLNSDLLYTKELNNFDAPDLTDAVYSFLCNLAEYGIVYAYDSDSRYYAPFKVRNFSLEQMQNIKKLNKFEKEELDMQMLQEEFEPREKESYSVNRMIEVQIESKRRQEIQEAVRQQMEKVESIANPKGSSLSMVSSIYDRPGLCKICGNTTTDWVSYELLDGTCICKECRRAGRG